MAKEKILIVDDEPDLVDVIRMRLEANDYEVITASNGLEGLEQVKREKPDLVILDILMPWMSGYDLLRALKKEQGDIKDTPVIIISARSKMKGLFEEIGVYAFVEKPFETQELLDKVKQALAQAEQKAATRKKALVIGRDKPTVELMKAFLESHNFSVKTAENGSQGIEKAVKMQPNIIFTQSIMEDMDGTEVCRIVHGMSGLQKVPLVIFSSREAAFVVDETMVAEKLIEYDQPQELIEKIDAYLKEY